MAFLFELTIPDCKKSDLKHKYVTTFIMSIVWIGAQCYAITWCIERVGCIFAVVCADQVAPCRVVAAS